MFCACVRVCVRSFNRACYLPHTINTCISPTTIEYEQAMQQSQTADQPMAARGRHTDSHSTLKGKQKHSVHPQVDWLQSLKQFFINEPNHIHVASLTLMALF